MSKLTIMLNHFQTPVVLVALIIILLASHPVSQFFVLHDEEVAFLL